MISQTPRCHVEVRRRRRRVILVVSGELDIASAQLVRRELDQLRHSGCQEVAVDLSEVSFMDAAGVRLLLGARAQAARDGFSVIVAAASRQVCRIFRLTGTDHLLAAGVLDAPPETIATR